MSPATVSDVLNLYIQLRRQSMTPAAALAYVRDDIESMTQAEQSALVRQVRAFEGSVTSTPQSAPKPPDRSSTVELPGVKPISGKVSQQKQICSNCGAETPEGELFCDNCGWPIALKGPVAADQQGTVPLTPKPNLDPAMRFDADSTLVLTVAQTGAVFRVQPQRLPNEVIIGRSAENFAIRPQVDLAGQDASTHGVSRAHASIHYNRGRQTLVISDMESANGTFLNGMPLQPRKEIELRSGDELRLGRLVLNVRYERGKPQP